MSYRAREIIVRKQDQIRKSRRERVKALERAGSINSASGRADFTRVDSLSDYALASAGSLYGGSQDDLGAMSDVVSEPDTGSVGAAGAGAGAAAVPPLPHGKRRSVGTLFLDNTNHLTRFNSYTDLGADPMVMHEQYGEESGAGGAADGTFSWDTVFAAPSETEKFAAIEALFVATGVDLRAIPGAGPKVCDAEPGVTRVRLEHNRSLVLFAPSLGHAVAALPEASAEHPEELAFVICYPRLHGRADEDVRDAAAAFVSGQYLAGSLSPATLRVAVTLLAMGAQPQHFTFSRNAPDGYFASSAASPPPAASRVGGGSPLAPDGEFREVRVARGFWPHVAAQMEVERLANFQVDCVGMLSSRSVGRQRNVNFVKPSEYAIGVFLAEEAVPQSRRGAKLPQRDRRVFLRAAVYHKELLLAGAEPPSPGDHKRTPSGSVAIDLAFSGPGTAGGYDDSVLADVLGRGLHSFIFQLNLSRV